MTLHPTGGIELSKIYRVYLLAITLKRFSLSPNIWCALHWKINNETKKTDTTHSLSLRSYAHMERNFYDHTINIYWRRLYEPTYRFELDNRTDEAISLFLCVLIYLNGLTFNLDLYPLIWFELLSWFITEIKIVFFCDRNSWKIEHLYDYLMMLIKHVIIWLDFSNILNKIKLRLNGIIKYFVLKIENQTRYSSKDFFFNYLQEALKHDISFMYHIALCITSLR